jgi:hypothetical protein
VNYFPSWRLLNGLDEIVRHRTGIATAVARQPDLFTRRGFSMLWRHAQKWAPRSEARTHQAYVRLTVGVAVKRWNKEELSYGAQCWRAYARDRTRRKANKAKSITLYNKVVSMGGKEDWFAFVARMHRQTASIPAMEVYHKEMVLRQWKVKYCRPSTHYKP